MEKDFYRFTPRTTRIIDKVKKRDCIIEPYHFLIGACEEGTGPCGEVFLYLYKQIGADFIEQIEKVCDKETEVYTEWKGIKVSSATVDVLERANEKKEHYGQALMNEGHILYAVIEKEVSLREILTKEMLTKIFTIACTPRDLTVHLGDYVHKTFTPYNKIRRANLSDLPALEDYVLQEFGERWLEHINHSYNMDVIPILLAEQNGSIIGFACYDLVHNQKGLFGPMGTSKDKRFQFVGRELLDTCLIEMAKLRYQYAIIGEAGPVEFYEKACNAKLIPLEQ
ncbi:MULTISPECIES: GNAT family N-acetyltransferase [Pontibacillus]|uniref:GNAT family N-acetyltransferase n=1 Tax=Pontibacillus chungwhensis TaxID=265426 RepID=A0ABY8UTM1_9BACI|nr:MULTISPECIES: GNAT family N-acetyltransferase [Pontibacillus]MCD5323387.1 GNAT family N-acetyltransferase [Pontibacillus sp. HN14]WIF96768.1 GNAT family N-acetyltransferase [Pontibacillus chungwhensis]